MAAMEMNLDITSRKQLEERLERSEKKYHDIFNNIRNAIFVLDAETLTVIDCNNSVQSVYGYSREEIVDHSFLDLDAPLLIRNDPFAGVIFDEQARLHLPARSGIGVVKL